MNLANVKIGACNVYFNNASLGHTHGGVTVTYTPEYVDMTVDQWGNTPFDKSLLAEEVMITVILAETQIDSLEKAMPTGTKTGATDSRLEIGRNAGFRLATVAGKLKLRPIAATDASEDVVLTKAVVVDEVEISYNNEDHRLLEITFQGLIDTTQTNGSYLGYFGDSTD